MRVTAGLYRGRRLSVPKGNDVRPTTDMVRQAVFNILLQYDLPAEAHVVDGFCGTGALGLEALSRGAVSCTFIDKDTRTVQENAENIGVSEDCTFIRKDVRSLNACPSSQEKAQLLFLDPPYRQDFVVPALRAFADKDWLAEDALCVIETEKEFTLSPPADFKILDNRDYGDSQIILCRYKSAPEE